MFTRQHQMISGNCIFPIYVFFNNRKHILYQKCTLPAIIQYIPVLVSSKLSAYLITEKSSALRRRTILSSQPLIYRILVSGKLSTRPFIYHISVNGKLSIKILCKKHPFYTTGGFAFSFTRPFQDILSPKMYHGPPMNNSFLSVSQSRFLFLSIFLTQ